MALTPRQSRHLRSLAHHLDPIVFVGAGGVSDAVVTKTDRELEIHELLKVRIQHDREEVRTFGAELAQATNANLVQTIGKIAVLYRRRAKKPAIRLPG